MATCRLNFGYSCNIFVFEGVPGYSLKSVEYSLLMIAYLREGGFRCVCKTITSGAECMGKSNSPPPLLHQALI